MTQLFRYTCNVCTVGNGDAGKAMPELVRVQTLDTVLLCEVLQIAGRALGMYRLGATLFPTLPFARLLRLRDLQSVLSCLRRDRTARGRDNYTYFRPKYAYCGCSQRKRQPLYCVEEQPRDRCTGNESTEPVWGNCVNPE